MSGGSDDQSKLSRRKFLSLTGGIVAGSAALGIGAATGADAAVANRVPLTTPSSPIAEPFWGNHQSGIITRSQRHTYFATFDITTDKKSDLVELLKYWTTAASRLAIGETAEPLNADETQPPADSGEAAGLSPERLTITLGFGPGLFSSDGKDRFNLAAHSPEPLVDLPHFSGDQLVDLHTGGDLSVQACADDPMVAFHAVRQLARLAYGSAQIRWTQAGFLPNSPTGSTPRNLMGFKDGSRNVVARDEIDLDQYVWSGSESPTWMQGGSYLVARRVRIALEHWDRMSVAFQEQTFGRQKDSGAPLGGKTEFSALNLDANDKDGNPMIAQNAHIRLATAASNDGAQILRRSYSYNDGVSFTSERWPPWRQGMEYDAGLLFICYQRDPRSGFIRLFDKMSKIDMLNQFATHVGGGLFACPGGAKKGEYIGQRLLEG